MKKESKIESPVRRIREECDSPKCEFAAAFYFGQRWLDVLENGGAERLPEALVEFAEEFHGPGGGAKLIADYAAFRESIGEAARARLEAMIYPGGKWAGRAPGISTD